MPTIPEVPIPNFHFCRTAVEMPRGYCSVTNIFVENNYEAQRYAYGHPDREIYWLDDLKKAVWYRPIRRVTDRLPFLPA